MQNVEIYGSVTDLLPQIVVKILLKKIYTHKYTHAHAHTQTSPRYDHKDAIHCIKHRSDFSLKLI